MATLYLVSTPIGNLEDVSERAAAVLRSVDRILAEDTRHTRKLTARVESEAPLVSLHAHNERERSQAVLAWLDEGQDLALVSDAGTPLVSDPGASLVRDVAHAGHRVVPVPGPSAVLAALVASGLPTDRFAFLGFPERKGKERAALLERIAASAETVVLFESPRRTLRLLEDLSAACGQERRAAVAREMTKLHEEVRRGTLADLVGYYREHEIRGEVTVVVGPAGAREAEAALEARLGRAAELGREMLAEGTKPSAAAKQIASELDLPRNEAYRIVQSLREDRESR